MRTQRALAKENSFIFGDTKTARGKLPESSVTTTTPQPSEGWRRSRWVARIAGGEYCAFYVRAQPTLPRGVGAVAVRSYRWRGRTHQKHCMRHPWYYENKRG